MGILTGVRPTKLYHKFRKEGKSEQEIADLLIEISAYQRKSWTIKGNCGPTTSDHS